MSTLIPLNQLTGSRIWESLSGAQKLQAYDAWSNRALEEAKSRGIQGKELSKVEAQLAWTRNDFTGNEITGVRKSIANARSHMATLRAQDAEFRSTANKKILEAVESSLKPGEAVLEGNDVMFIPRNARLLTVGAGERGHVYAVPEGTKKSKSLEDFRNEIAAREPELASFAAKQLQGADEQEQAAQRLPVSPQLQQLTEEMESGEYGKAAKTLFNPVNFPKIVSNVMAESSVSLGAAVAGGVVAGPAGAGVGGLGPEFAASYREGLRDIGDAAGIDTSNPEGMAKAMMDDNVNDQALKRAATRAGVIGAFNVISQGIAGKIVNKFKGNFGKQVAAGAVAGGVTEGTGEGVAQRASGQEFSATDVLLETLGGPGETIGQVAGEAAKRTIKKYKSPDAKKGQIYDDPETGEPMKVTDIRETANPETGELDREVTAESYIVDYSEEDMEQIARDYEAEMLDSLQGQSVTLDEAINDIGGLVSPSKAAQYGEEFRQVFNESGAKVGNQRIGRFRDDGKQYDIAIQQLRQYGFQFDSPSELADAIYRNDSGDTQTAIPLSAYKTPDEAFSRNQELGSRKLGNQESPLPGNPDQPVNLVDPESIREAARESTATPEEATMLGTALAGFQKEGNQRIQETRITRVDEVPGGGEIMQGEAATITNDNISAKIESGEVRSLLFSKDEVIDEAEAKNQVGEEHYVIDDPNDSNRVLKVAKNGHGKGGNDNFQSGLDGYLQRLQASNDALGTDFRLEGVIGTSANYDTVVSQTKADRDNRETDFVPWAQAVTQDLQAKGFRQVDPETWESDVFVADDVNPQNVYVVDGKVHYLDVQVSRKSGLLGQSGNDFTFADKKDVGYLKRTVTDFLDTAQGKTLHDGTRESRDAIRPTLWRVANQAAREFVRKDPRRANKPLSELPGALKIEIKESLNKFVDEGGQIAETRNDERGEQQDSREERGTLGNGGVDTEVSKNTIPPFIQPLGRGENLKGPLGSSFGDGSLQPTTGWLSRKRQLDNWITGDQIGEGDNARIKDRHSFRDFIFWLGENPLWVLDAKEIGYYEGLMGMEDLPEAGRVVQKTIADYMGRHGNKAAFVENKNNIRSGQDINVSQDWRLQEALLDARIALLGWLNDRTAPMPQGGREPQPAKPETPENAESFFQEWPDTQFEMIWGGRDPRKGPIIFWTPQPEPSLKLPPLPKPKPEDLTRDQVLSIVQKLEDIYAEKFPTVGEGFKPSINKDQAGYHSRPGFRRYFAIGLGFDKAHEKRNRGHGSRKGKVVINPFSSTPYQERNKFPSLEWVIDRAYKEGKTNEDILRIAQFVAERANLLAQESDNWQGFFDRSTNLIGLLPTANPSTVFHETAHLGRQMLAGTELGDILNKAYQTDGDNWTVSQEESFARDFERYLRDGRPPKGATAKLRRAFSVVAEMMRQIYTTLTGSPLANDIKPEVREVLDRVMLSGDRVMNRGQTLNRQVSASAVNNKNPNRIPISPLEGDVKLNSKVMFDAGRNLGASISYKTGKKGTYGSYFTGSSRVSIEYEGDLDTTAHELGHAIDDRMGLGKAIQDKGLANAIDSEILRPEFQATTQSGDPISVKRTEGLAEFVRGLMVNPQLTRSKAPTLAKLFDDLIQPPTLRAMKKFGDAIRAWEAAPASNKILANTQMGMDSPIARMVNLFRGRNKANQDGFVVSGWDRLAALVTDDKHPFISAVNYIEKLAGEKPLPADDPRILARLLQGVGSKELEVMERGMVNAKQEFVLPGGVDWLFEPFGKDTAKNLDRMYNDAVALMIAERTIELADKLGREDALTGAGAGVRSDLEVARDAVYELQQDPDRYAKLQEAGNRYRQWADANLQYLVDKGRMTKKQYRDIKDNNEYYVAFNRIMEAAPGEEMQQLSFGAGKNLGSVSETIHRLKGSTKTIQNPYKSLLESSAKIMREADRNEVLASFVDLLDANSSRGMYEDDPNQLASIGFKLDGRKKLPPNTQVIYRKGKKEYWQFEPDIYAALKGLGNIASVPGWMRLGMIPARVLRAGVTMMPDFAVRNLMRDTQARFLVSRSRLRESLKSTLPKRDRAEILEALKLGGGDQAGHYTKDQSAYIHALDSALRDLATDKNSIVMSGKRFAEFFGQNGPYRRLLERGEQANRLAEYRAAFAKGKEMGYDDFNAHLFANAQARDLMDFAVGGTAAKAINQFIPFFNAAIQGTRRTVRAGKENPGVFAARFALFAIIPTVMHRALIAGMGDEVEEEYEEMPDYLRDMFWNFKIADNKWLRIPKSFEAGVLASFSDRAIGRARGFENAFDGFLTSLRKSFIPVDGATLYGPFRPWLEASSNYDSFREKTIISPFQVGTKLDAKNKKGERIRKMEQASRIGQMFQLASEGVGLSNTKVGKTYFDARVADHLIKGTFGGMGDAALRVSNLGRTDTSRVPGWRNTGLVVDAPGYSSKSVQEVYAMARDYGLRQDKLLNNLDDLINESFEVRTERERDEIARKIRVEARRIKPILEAQIKKLNE
jgi:hypothetical protein